MKKQSSKIRRSILTATATVAFVLAQSATAAILLTIDPTDPGAVVISSTGLAPLVDDSSADSNAGITLTLVFANDFILNGSSPVTGNLTPNGGTSAYDAVLNEFASLTPRDMNLFQTNASSQSFSTSLPAFSGQMVVDLTGAVFAMGSTGDVIVGDTASGSGAVIGQW